VGSTKFESSYKSDWFLISLVAQRVNVDTVVSLRTVYFFHSRAYCFFFVVVRGRGVDDAGGHNFVCQLEDDYEVPDEEGDGVV